jgi:predicted nucleic acid-binding protein
VLYLDSSALVKHYLQELGTESLKARLLEEEQKGFPLYTASISYAEIHASIRRRTEAKLLTEEIATQIQDQFDSDWLFTYTHIEMSAGVLGFIREVLKQVHVKSAGAIHLASSLWLKDTFRLKSQSRGSNNVFFACSDRQLSKAMAHFGLEVFDPETTK